MTVTGGTLPFERLERLGAGACGEVYRVRDGEGQMRAAKFLFGADHMTDLDRLRFRREFEVLASLSHPHIVRVHSLHEEVPCFTMDLIDGEELDVWVQQFEPHMLRQAPARDAFLTLICQLLQALAAMHEAGIYHRDVKPGNIRVAAGPHLVLMDFGIAHVAAAERLTQQDVLMGTPLYMAPELFSGGSPDPRTDLYSVGAILYEACGGELPRLEGNSLLAALQAILNWEPTRLQLSSPDIDPWLSDYVDRLMAREADARPASAREAEKLLRARLSGDGAATLAPSSEHAVRPRTSSGLYEPALAGRAESLQQLKELVSRLTGGEEFMLTLAGESGSGKTRMIMELQRVALRGGIRLFRGACLEGDPTPYSVFRPLLRRALEPMTHQDPAQWERLFGANLPLLARLLPDVAIPGTSQPAASLDPGQERLQLFEVVLRALATLRMQGPCIFCFDDLQWADAASLDLMRFMAARMVEDATRGSSLGALAIVAVYRSDEVAEDHALLAVIASLKQRLAVTPMHLLPLTESQVQEMTASMLGGADVPQHLARHVTDVSGGSPLFVKELVEALVADGIYAWHDGAFHQQQDERRLSRTPPAMADLVERRLRLMGPVALDVVNAAAVLGKQFAFTMLADMLDGLDEDALYAAYEQLLKARLLQERRDEGRDIVSFHHDKYREIVLERISSARRQKLHRMAVAAYERQGEKPGNLDRLAMHCVAAGESAKAVSYLIRVARNARSQHANRKAIASYQDILRLEPAPDVRTECEEGIADVMSFVGDGHQALPMYDALLQGAREAPRLASLERRRAQACLTVGLYREGISGLLRALGHLGAAPPQSRAGLQLSILSGLVRHLPYVLRLKQPRPANDSPREAEIAQLYDMLKISYYWSEGIPHRDLVYQDIFFKHFLLAMEGGGGQALARTLAVYGVGQLFQSNPAFGLARSMSTRAIALTDEIDDDVVKAEVHRYCAWGLVQMSEIKAASRHADVAIELSRKAEDAHGLLNTLVISSVVRHWEGRFEESADYGRQAAELGELIGNRSYRIMGTFRIALAREVQGRLDEMETALRQVEEWIEGQDYNFERIYVAMCRGLALAQCGDLPGGRRMMERSRELIGMVKIGAFFEAMAEFYAADLAVDAADWTAVETHVRRWKRRAARMPLYQGWLLRHQGLLMHTRGRPGADVTLRKGAALLSDIGARDEQGRTLAHLGLITGDDKILDEAREILTHCQDRAVGKRIGVT